MLNKPKQNTRIILGIDPGYDRLGIALIEKTGSKDVLIHSECLQTSSKDDIYTRLYYVGRKISSVLDDFQPTELAIENLFITKNQKTAMRVSEARGIILYECKKREIAINEYTPMEIKSAICGDGTSDKIRIIKMIHMLIKPTKKILLDDEYDAIAVALTHSAIQK